jgi:hypothetical protein
MCVIQKPKKWGPLWTVGTEKVKVYMPGLTCLQPWETLKVRLKNLTHAEFITVFDQSLCHKKLRFLSFAKNPIVLLSDILFQCAGMSL